MQQTVQPDDLITVTEAAKLLELNKSTVSRQIGRHFVNYGAGGRPMLSRAQVLAAHATFKNRAMIRTETAPVEPPPAPAAAAATDTRGHWDTIAAKEKALQASMDRRERAGELVARKLVDEAGFAAGRLLQDEMLALAVDLGPELAGLTEAREITLVLDRRFRALLERIGDETERLMPAPPEEDRAAA